MLRTAMGKRFGADSFCKNSQLRAHGSQLGKLSRGGTLRSSLRRKPRWWRLPGNRVSPASWVTGTLSFQAY